MVSGVRSCFLERRTLLRAWAGVLILAMSMGTAMADPPVILPEDLRLPQLYCFRMTDIQRVESDPEGDRFLFEFEVLNWTNQNAYGLMMAINTIHDVEYNMQEDLPFIAGAQIDENGRPLGPGDDNANFPPNDGTTTNTKPGNPNLWRVLEQTGTMVVYDAGDYSFENPDDPFGPAGGIGDISNREVVGIPTINLLFSASTEDACAKIPGCEFTPDGSMPGQGTVSVPSCEFVDNATGGSQDISTSPPLSFDFGDNVLDGFVLDVDDFDDGEILSLNWFLLDFGNQPIGTNINGNSFGFGVSTSRAGRVSDCRSCGGQSPVP